MFRVKNTFIRLSVLVRKFSVSFSHNVNVQPAIKCLLIEQKDRPAYDCSKFTKVFSGSVQMLPFVGRERSLQLIAEDLVDNMVNNLQNNMRTQSFSCAGEMYATGKTKFAINLARYIAKNLKEQGDDHLKKSTLVSVHIENTKALKSLYSIWENFILKDPSLSELKSLVNSSMSLDELLSATGTFLTEQNKVLYLHLDEFIPSNALICELFLARSYSMFKSGELQGVDVLDMMLNETLLSFLSTQRMMLFVTGKSPLFDHIGVERQSLYKVVRPPMELLEKMDIVEILDEFYVHQTNELAPMSLSAVLRLVVQMPEDRAQEDCVDVLSGEIHELSRGVPLYVEHAINGVLRLPDAPCLFAATKHKEQVPLSVVSSGLSNPANYTFSVDSLGKQIKKAIDLLPKLHKLHMRSDLLALLGAISTPLLVSEDIYVLAKMKPSSSIGRLLTAAHFWGVSHTYDSAVRGVRFVIPRVSEGMVQDCSSYLADEEYDGTGQQNELRIRRALLMDRTSLYVDNGRPSLLSSILSNQLYERDWLAKIAPGNLVATEQLRSTSHIRYVPKVSGQGRASIDDLRDYSKRTQHDKYKPNCSPKVLAQFMVEKSEQPYLIMVPDAMHSASGDTFVVHYKLWVHFQLKDAVKFEAVAELWKLLSVVQFAPTRQGYEHILILQNANKNTDMRKAVLRAVVKLLVAASTEMEEKAIRRAFWSFKDLPSEDAVQRLKAKAQDKKDKAKDKMAKMKDSRNAKAAANDEKLQLEVETKVDKLKTEKTESGADNDLLAQILRVLCAHTVHVILLSEQENNKMEVLGDQFLFQNR